MVARGQVGLYDVKWCADALLDGAFATISEVGTMSFFLLGKDSDGRLTLLSETALATRQAAMAELSRITADPSFSSWDDEVVVMDLDAGTPVLLVRPATGASDAGDASVVEADEAGVAAEDSEATDENEPEPEIESEAPDAAEEESAAEDRELAQDEVEIDEPEMPEDAGVAETPALDGESAAQEDGEEISLKEALQRTAEQMESEGISAPDSIGPAEESAVPASDDEEAAAEQTPDETGDEGAEAAGDAGGPAEEAQAWPWDAAPSADQSADAEPAPFVLDALEEPGTDDGGLVRAPGDDETMSSARPVILGAYGEADATIDPAAAAETTAVDEPVAPADEAPAHVANDAAADAEMSDFILDLEPVPSGYELSSSSQTQMSCLDCIYERTCPHKDVGPPDCGSFQWK